MQTVPTINNYFENINLSKSLPIELTMLYLFPTVEELLKINTNTQEVYYNNIITRIGSKFNRTTFKAIYDKILLCWTDKEFDLEEFNTQFSGEE